MQQLRMIFVIAFSAALPSIAQTPPAQTKAQPTVPPPERGQPSPALPLAAFFSAVAAAGSWVVAGLNFRMTQQLKRRDTFQKVADILDDPEHRAARRKTRELQQANTPLADIMSDEHARKCVDQVCRDFDLLGLFDNAKAIDRTLVDRFYVVPFIKLYPFLKGYIDHLRSPAGENRGLTHFWEVDQFYERVKTVVHPSEMYPPRSDWPKNARSPR